MVRPGAAFALSLLLGCAAHEPPQPAPRPSARVEMAAALGLELAGLAGSEPLAADLSVWIGPSEVTLTRGDGTVVRELAALERGSLDPAKAPNFLIEPLYRAVFPAEGDRELEGVNIYADRRVPVVTVASAIFTLARAGAGRFHLVGGSPEGLALAVIDLDWPRGSYVPTHRIRELRSDLAVVWGPRGVQAWALPRSARRRPFAGDRTAPPPTDDGAPEDPRVVDQVPLTPVAGADPPLDVVAAADLVAALCEFNHREPIGIRLEPAALTPWGEVLEFAVATTPPAGCRGPLVLNPVVEARPHRTGAVSLAELPARVLPALD